MKKKYYLLLCRSILILMFVQNISTAQTHYLSFHYEPMWTSVSHSNYEADYFLPISLGVSYSCKIVDYLGVSIRGGYIMPVQRYFGGFQYGAYIKYFWDTGLNLMVGVNNNKFTSGNHPNFSVVNKKEITYFAAGIGYPLGAFDLELQYLSPVSREIGYELINAPTVEGSHSPIYINSMIKLSIAYSIEL